MTYTQEEKMKIDQIVEAFSAYIIQHTYFDIAYSDKIGYVRLLVDETQENEAVRIRTAEQMFKILINEIVVDVAMDRQVSTPEQARQESSRRIKPYLEKFGEHKQQAEMYMEAYLKKYICEKDYEEL